VRAQVAIIILITFIFLACGCLTLREAYVPDVALKDGWIEDTEKEEEGSSFLGLEKWSIKVYEKNDVAWLTVTTLKTLFLEERGKLLERVESGIRKDCKDMGINVEEKGFKGSRELQNGHNSYFVIFNGSDGKNAYKVIGEVWSCSISGISVMCVGMAKVTELDGLIAWREIVSDPRGTIDSAKGNGLIYSVKCH